MWAADRGGARCRGDAGCQRLPAAACCCLLLPDPPAAAPASHPSMPTLRRPALPPRRFQRTHAVTVDGVTHALPFEPLLWALGQDTHAAWRAARLPARCSFYNLYGSGISTPYDAQYGAWWWPLQARRGGLRAPACCLPAVWGAAPACAGHAPLARLGLCWERLAAPDPTPAAAPGPRADRTWRLCPTRTPRSRAGGGGWAAAAAWPAPLGQGGGQHRQPAAPAGPQPPAAHRAHVSRRCVLSQTLAHAVRLQVCRRRWDRAHRVCHRARPAPGGLCGGGRVAPRPGGLPGKRAGCV